MFKEILPKWIFVIDTDLYAGNFEREMCAYITGELGDCEVGHQYAALFCKDMNKNSSLYYFEEIIESCPDDHGFMRPCSIWNTKENGTVTNSVAIFFHTKPKKLQIQLMKERSLKFAEVRREIDKEFFSHFKLKIFGFRLLKVNLQYEATIV